MNGKTKVCILLKSLCGLKQTSRQCNLKLTHSLLKHVYTQSKFNYSLFNKFESEAMHLLVYVDDLLISDSNEHMIVELKGILQFHFKLEDLGS